MRLLRKNESGEVVHDSTYFDAWDLYTETNNFVFLVDCFLICHEKDYEFPVELISELAGRFTRFINADNKREGMAALGFDNNSDGGAWQLKAAKATINKYQITGLLNDLILLTGKKNLNPKYDYVAKACNTTRGFVKKLYYSNKK